jgi:hypothetical protein
MQHLQKGLEGIMHRFILQLKMLVTHMELKGAAHCAAGPSNFLKFSHAKSDLRCDSIVRA